jgi:cyclic pyranopterin phosphate synthase
MIVEVKIGTACNNNCIFCLNESRQDSRDLISIIEELKELAKEGVSGVQFTGGEITIRPDYADIIMTAKQHNLWVQVQTNGRAFCYKEIAKKSAHLGIDSFLVSLHANTEELGQKITNTRHAYRQTVEGIKNLKHEGLKVIINTVVNNENVMFLPAIVEHHITLKPELIQLSWARPSGKVLKDIDIIPKYSEFSDQLFESIEKAKSAGQKISIIGVPLCILGRYRAHIARPYLGRFGILKGKLIPAENIFNTKKKTKISECKICSFDNECGGIFNEYLKKHGQSEFKHIDNLEEIKNDVSSALGDRMMSVELHHRGYGGNSYLSTTETGRLFFLKEREITEKQKTKEKELNDRAKKSGIFVLDPIRTIEFNEKYIEIFPFIQKKVIRPESTGNQIITDIAKMLGTLHKSVPEKIFDEHYLQELFEFSQKTPILNDQQKQSIIHLKTEIDKRRRVLKKSIIHNDLHIGNLIIDETLIGITNLEKTAEFYCSWDAAKTILSIGYDPDKNEALPEKITVFLREYKKWVGREDFEVLFPFTIFTIIEQNRNLQNETGRIDKSFEEFAKRRLNAFLDDNKVADAFTSSLA